MTGPYGAAYEAYWAAGWRGLLPLPPRAKAPPREGWTGRGAPYPSYADVRAWADGPEGAGNIALRLPADIIGLDVDDYFGHTGGATLRELEGALGTLPETYVSTARDGLSGIRLFRVAEGGRWPGAAGAGIEIIQAAHRYAVVWPSVHPELGKIYRWVSSGALGLGVMASVPELVNVPALPETWVTYLRGLVSQDALPVPAELDDGGLHEWVRACRRGEACPPVRDVAQRAIEALKAREVRGSRHELTRDASRSLCAFGGSGHAGVVEALLALRAAFVEALGGDRDPLPEWDRMLGGAVRLAAAVDPTPRQDCDCALWAGEGVQFDVTTAEPGSTEAPGGATAPGDLADELGTRLMTAAQVRELPAPEPLIDGLLTLDSLSYLIARSSSYKSFLALDWAGHVAAGREWFGRKVAHGPVFYMVAEGVGGMGPRVRAWEQRNGEMSGVHFLPFPIQVGRADAWGAWVDLAARRRPVLIILDTQARITVGLDENDNSAMGQAIEAIERLRRASGACVLVVHHLGRSGADARGASAIDAAQDTELKLTRTADRRAVLTIDKSRHGADDARVDIELYLVELDRGDTSLVVGEPLSPIEPDWRANLTTNQVTLVEIMFDIFMPVGATKAELKSEARKRGRRDPIRGELEPMGESAYRRAWASLVGLSRFVRVEGAQRYVAVQATEVDTEDQLGVSE